MHYLVPPDVWGARYDEINAFERELVESLTMKMWEPHSSSQRDRRGTAAVDAGSESPQVTQGCGKVR